MRLLNTTTYQLVEFNGAPVPDYGILSHTWDFEEVSFVDMQDQATIRWKVGYSKVKECCGMALNDGLCWVWIDTCCIDRRSSAELSEAINSMFQWYRNSKLCYVYLSDITNESHVCKEDLAECRWFTRGWPLLELIASPTIQFFNWRWDCIGNKNSLHDVIMDITGIPPEVLRDSANLATASVAQKMSWAAKRETARIEDKAYSLMGLFGINMPILYGEGERAFERLQLEIIKKSYDYSIFAWKVRDRFDRRGFDGAFCGLLASSPAQFADSGKIRPYPVTSKSQPFHKTNLGIYISLPIDTPRKTPRVAGVAELLQVGPISKVYLPCYYEGTCDRNPHIVIYVQETSKVRRVTIAPEFDHIGSGLAHYVRVLCTELTPVVDTPPHSQQIMGPKGRDEACQWPYAYFHA